MTGNISEKEKILEDFILKNPELDKLENLLGVFNVFETLDIVNAEIRHSNVLAWLFNPDSNHGFSEFFLKQFLKLFMSENKEYIEADINLFDFELFNYSNVEIRREWNNIDLVIILNEPLKKVIITIENKISASEHSSQLQRYRKIIEKEFNNFEKIFIFLSPNHAVPSDENWVVMTYTIIADLIGDLLNLKKDNLSNNVYNFINQYNTILRRYIVGNSEIEEICRSIYKKHQKALDLIFQYKPDIILEISEYLQNLLKKDKRVTYVASGKTYIDFASEAMKKIVTKIIKDSPESNNILYFEFRNYEDRLVLCFLVGPGKQEYRQKLFELCKSKKELFKKTGNTLYQKYNAVYQKEILGSNDYNEASIDELSVKINKKWEEFCKGDLIKINEFIDTINLND